MLRAALLAVVVLGLGDGVAWVVGRDWRGVLDPRSGLGDADRCMARRRRKVRPGSMVVVLRIVICEGILRDDVEQSVPMVVQWRTPCLVCW